MKASKRMKKLQKRLDSLDEDIQAIMDEKDYCYLKIQELKADLLLEKDAFNEAPWDLISNMNSHCNFNLYGGQHCLNSDIKGNWDDGKDKLFVQRPKLFKIMSDEKNWETDFYYENNIEGWTLSATNGRVTVFFDSPAQGYAFMLKYNLKVNSKDIEQRIEELNILLCAQDAANFSRKMGLVDE